MDTKTRQVKAWEEWVKRYEETGSVRQAALKAGIPRSTSYRWLTKFRKFGQVWPEGYSKRPKVFAKQKISEELVELIVSIRREFHFGPQKISQHLLRSYNIKISASTIWRVIKCHNLPPITPRQDSVQK
jgi:transposase